MRGENVGDGKRRDNWKCGSADGEYGAREPEARFRIDRGRNMDKSISSKCGVPKDINGAVFSFRERDDVKRGSRGD